MPISLKEHYEITVMFDHHNSEALASIFRIWACKKIVVYTTADDAVAALEKTPV